jgi:DNA-binding phage protein
MLSGERNPGFSTVINVLQALDIQLAAKPGRRIEHKIKGS